METNAKYKLAGFASQVNDLIRCGQGDRARRELKRLGGLNLGRPDRSVIAFLSWRADYPLLGIQLLNPVVRDRSGKHGSPTVRERAEYAACLIRLGGGREAMTILEALPSGGLPRVLLYRAFVHFQEWDYKACIPLLTEYLRTKKLDTYDRLVAGINLAGAYVHLKEHATAEKLLRELAWETAEGPFMLANAETMKLGAENFISRRQWGKAESLLARAETLHGKVRTNSSHFIRKWRAIMEVFKNGKRRLPLLQKIREEAVEMGIWETLRECDRVEAICTGSREVFEHLYFGTPYPMYRDRLVEDVRPDEALSESYLWALGGAKPTARGTRGVLDITSEVRFGEKQVSIDPKSRRLVEILCSDFYRPHRLATLHYHLFPGDFFNPISSPGRVRSAIYRLRNWFAEYRMPFSIGEFGGTYRLQGERGAAIRIPAEGMGGSKLERAHRQIRAIWKDSSFSAKDLASKLEVSQRSAQRLVKDLLIDGKLRQSGEGSAIRYCVA